MDTEEAFKRLGLTSAATREEINAAYRQKSKAAHPDVAGGTSESQTELGEARKIALDHSSEGRELTIWREKLPALEQAVNAIIFQQQAEQIKNSLKQRQSSRLIWMKSSAAWIGVSLAAATALVTLYGVIIKQVAAELQNAEITAVLDRLSLAFVLLAAVSGLWFAFLKFRIDHLSVRIEDYNDSLSLSDTCARELAALMKYDNQKFVDLQEVIESYERAREQERTRRANLSFRESLLEPPKSPFEQFSLSLTASEKAPLVFKKAQEHKLIKKLEFSADDKQFRDRYEVLFSPASLAPSSQR